MKKAHKNWNEFINEGRNIIIVASVICIDENEQILHGPPYTLNPHSLDNDDNFEAVIRKYIFCCNFIKTDDNEIVISEFSEDIDLDLINGVACQAIDLSPRNVISK